MRHKQARLLVGCDDVPTLPAPRGKELPGQPVGLSCKAKLPGTDRPVCSKPALIGAAIPQDPAASDEAPALPSALELRAEKVVWLSFASPRSLCVRRGGVQFGTMSSRYASPKMQIYLVMKASSKININLELKGHVCG
jgi:hypothetical protein